MVTGALAHRTCPAFPGVMFLLVLICRLYLVVTLPTVLARCGALLTKVVRMASRSLRLSTGVGLVVCAVVRCRRVWCPLPMVRTVVPRCLGATAMLYLLLTPVVSPPILVP